VLLRVDGGRPRIRVGPELAAKLRAMMTIPDARPPGK
jgi:hypothetical protein